VGTEVCRPSVPGNHVTIWTVKLLRGDCINCGFQTYYGFLTGASGHPKPMCVECQTSGGQHEGGILAEWARNRKKECLDALARMYPAGIAPDGAVMAFVRQIESLERALRMGGLDED